MSDNSAQMATLEVTTLEVRNLSVRNLSVIKSDGHISISYAYFRAYKFRF
jgi:hypothetical protein